MRCDFIIVAGFVAEIGLTCAGLDFADFVFVKWPTGGNYPELLEQHGKR